MAAYGRAGGLATCLALVALAAGCGEAPADTETPSAVTTLAGRDAQGRFDEDGRLHLVWVRDDPDGGTPAVVYRRLGTDADPVRVSPPELNVSAHGEVPPALEVLPGGVLVTAYTVALPGKWRGEIRTQRSTDGGATWSEPRLLHDDADGTSHGFLSSTFDRASGRAVFAWLDNRGGRQGVVTTATADGLETEPDRVVDPLSCQCCATALTGAGDGSLHLAYRDLSDDGVRDLRHARTAGSAVEFSAPEPVAEDGWRIDGCPHTGPRLAADGGGEGDGGVWAVWFTGAEPGIYAARWSGGAFGPREPLAVVGEGVRGVAHPDVARLPDGRLLALWETSEGLRGRLYDDETWGEPFPVAGDGVYPRLVTGGAGAGGPVLLTTRHESGGSTVEVRVLEL